MKACAKFLNFLALIGFCVLLLATLALGAATAVVGLKPDLISADLLGSLDAATVNGQPITVEMLTSIRIPILIILGGLFLTMILTLVEVAQIRTALREVGEEDPFSVRCSKSLNTAAVLVVISGLIGVALSVYASVAFGGKPVSSSNAVQFTANLSFILVAVFLKMLAGISEFGRR